jgi:metal-responsive CopG/Arc/MetJ family transcriptional regulator
MRGMAKGQEVITFKVDPAVLELMKGIPNRSEFIRTAILSALDSICPLCKGNGVLTPKSKEHWDDFSKLHQMTECGHCDEIKIECIK